MLVPRWAYLSMCTDKVRRHFDKPAPAGPEEVPWFEINGQPLKWNVPVGVLWDLCGGGEDALPWAITVHFSGFPARELVACPEVAAVKAHYLNRVKESCQIKHGTTQHEGLQSDDVKQQLWLGLENDNYDQFVKASAPLMEAGGSGSWYKGFPFCLHSAAPGTAAGATPAVWTEQEPFRVLTEGGRPLTLGDLRAYMLSTEDAAAAPALVVHGTQPPPETPLQWLAQHYAYPDGFVHIVKK